MPQRILLQTTIPSIEDDWNIGRFSFLTDYLERLGHAVTARDRKTDSSGSDPLLRAIDDSDYDQLWLFAVDTGDGLTSEECGAITRFRQAGRGLLSSRDHMDLGSSLCTIGGVGQAHHFHTRNPDPDESLRVRDDRETLSIDYPNFHSGANGDYQHVYPVAPLHDLLKRSDGTAIEYFPAHPHEGSVSAPKGVRSSRVIATGKSQTTGRDFNLIVAFERDNDTHGNALGRAIAEASFHHFVDYNWDIDSGCPSGITEAPGSEIREHPERLDDVKQYVANLADWLGR